ncbi:hypothetical protein SBDP1_340008 [Syntrophobacter sp. SbD1]|nr:hypothetical protein SBDP1_340008 [Syntrophobacter sp. SbD1]
MASTGFGTSGSLNMDFEAESLALDTSTQANKEVCENTGCNEIVTEEADDTGSTPEETRSEGAGFFPLTAKGLIELQEHEVAGLFPLMVGEDFEALKAGIKERGILESIWLDKDGRIIDGRNRYRAYLELANPKIHLPMRTFLGDDNDLPNHVVELNKNRRHLSKAQYLVAAVEVKRLISKGAKERQLANLKRNRNAEPVNLPAREIGDSRDQAAKMFPGISASMIDRAEKVIQKGSPELVKAWKEGKLAASAACKLLALPNGEQTRIALLDKKEIAKEMRAVGETSRVEKIEALSVSKEHENVAEPQEISEAKKDRDESSLMQEMIVEALKILKEFGKHGYINGLWIVRDVAADIIQAIDPDDEAKSTFVDKSVDYDV